MDFMIDRVSEDSYYVNLLLGLPQLLDMYKHLNVQNKCLKRSYPVTHAEICSWEHKQGVLLPEDLRNFYSCTNGFAFSWTFNLMNDRKKVLAKIEIDSLNDLFQLFDYDVMDDANVDYIEGRYILKLGVGSKVFSLHIVNECTRVVVVYLNLKFAPTIWLYTQNTGFDFLANDFTTYFRMALIHLGLPSWQLLFTNQNIPNWTYKIMRIVAPGLLVRDKNDSKQKCNASNNLNGHILLNKLDQNVFKTNTKSKPIFPRIIASDTKSVSPISAILPKKNQLFRTKVYSRSAKKNINISKFKFK